MAEEQVPVDDLGRPLDGLAGARPGNNRAKTVEERERRRKEAEAQMRGQRERDREGDK